MTLNQVSTVFLQVVGTGAFGAPRSLYVFTDHRRYLFNCGEGTQRVASEHKVKLSSMENVFITHKTWENVGGLPGALLTLQESGSSHITIHGPPGLEILDQDTKEFMRFTVLKIDHKHYSEGGGTFSDEALHVQAVPIWSQEELLSESSNLLSESNGNENGSSSDLAIAYICKPTPKLGALLPERCRELGVPPGPLMGQLKRGEDVVLSNGNLIRASQVTKPPLEGPIFIVVEVPCESYLSNLLNCPQFVECQEENVPISVVIHFTSRDVVQTSLYQEWLSRFDGNTRHIYINENSRCMGSESVHKIQYKLNHVYPDSFPLLHESGFGGFLHSNISDEVNQSTTKKLKTGIEETDLCLSKSESVCINYSSWNLEIAPNHYQACTGLAYHVRPHLSIDTSKLIEINSQSYIEECYEMDNFKNNFQKVSEKIKEIKSKLPNEINKQIYPNILFLGTGSCIPNKFRNTSGIAVNLSSNCSILLDCGEGTFGQLVRHLGSSSANAFLRRLLFVYVSHLHADHHIGLIRIILARKAAFKGAEGKECKVPKLVLLAPRGIQHYLTSYSSNFECIADQFTMVPNNLLFNPNGFAEVTKLFPSDSLSHLPIEDLRTCYVHHCPNAFGILISLESWKLAYSGDTMPCQSFIDLGMDCDVLIHEATMEDDLKEDAKLKRHSTVSEAIEVGKRMNAANVILTHFSQRYNKVPLIDQLPPNVTIAFDNMQIHLSDLPLLPLLYPVYLSMFSEDVEEMRKKTQKYKTKTKLKQIKIS